MPAPIVPRYGDGALSDLLPAALGALAVPGEEDGLRLGALTFGARRLCVLLVDGLGWHLLRRHPAQAPFLSSLLRTGRALTTGLPATTATSLTSLGTGLGPGRHGVVGYTCRVPATGALLNSLKWDQPVDPEQWQPYPTVFERAARAGVAVSVVSKRQFRTSGLTRVGLRGGRFVAADTLGERVAAVEQALRGRPPALVYAYEGDLDYTGHWHGCASAAWRHQLTMVDRFAELVDEMLPAGAALVVTADHGMVDVPFAARVDVDAVPALREGVELIGGEARFRHVYTRAGAAGDVAAAWREVLGGRAVVRERAEVAADGWFGPLDERVRDRVGDVVVAVTGECAVEVSSVFPVESRLLGLHGAPTDDEMLVPLLVSPAGG